MTFREKLLPSKQSVFLAVNTWCPNFQKLTTINNSGSFFAYNYSEKKAL